MIVIGLGMIAYFGYTYVYTDFIQRRLSADFEQKKVSISKQEKKELAKPESAKLDPIDEQHISQVKNSKAYAKLLIPKINLDVIVVEGIGTEDLKKGPGHIPASAKPGHIGNMVISGHRVTFGAPFRNIDQLEPGDAITIYTPYNRYVYEVYGKKVVVPKDVSVIQPTRDAQLTLTACHPPHSAKYRLIIQARLVGDPDV